MASLPSVIYRYFNWEDPDSKKILTNTEMYFCNAKKWRNFGEYDFAFKQPDRDALFDAVINTAYNMHNTDRVSFDRWLNYHIQKFNIDISKLDRTTEVSRMMSDAYIVERIIWRRVDEMLANRPAYEASTKSSFFRMTGIFSTSLVSNSMQLWDWKQNFKQTNNGNAVCVGLDLTKIKTKLDTIGNYSMGLVDYKAKKNEIEFVGSGRQFVIDRLTGITFSLPEDAVKNLLEQQEFRILKFLTGNTSPKSIDRFLSLDPDFITEIIVHSNADDQTKNEIEAIAKALPCGQVRYF